MTNTLPHDRHIDGPDGSLLYCADAVPLATNRWFGYCSHARQLVTTLTPDPARRT